MPRNPRKYDVALNLVEWLTRTKFLTIDGKFQDSGEGGNVYGNMITWGVIRHATKTLKELEHIALLAQDDCVTLPPMIRWLRFLQMKRLEIRGLSTWENVAEQIEAKVHQITASHIFLAAIITTHMSRELTRVKPRNTVPQISSLFEWRNGPVMAP
jgi:translation initiation factor 2B subunit (eIF-2B alpha/beta/delta family)